MKRKPALRGLTDDERNGPPDTKRFVARFFQFWIVCPERRCKRARACVGDSQVCCDRWWPILPEDMKHSYRFTIKALAAGMTPHEACRHAEAEVARWREIERGWAEGRTAPLTAPAPTALPDFPSEPIDIPPEPIPSYGSGGPRIRRL